jgi:hypothetical protein
MASNFQIVIDYKASVLSVHGFTWAVVGPVIELEFVRDDYKSAEGKGLDYRFQKILELGFYKTKDSLRKVWWRM